MRCVFECRSSILRDSRAGYGPMVTERLEPDIPEAFTLELGLRRNRPNPNGSGAELGVRAPLDLVSELPMKSCSAITARRKSAPPKS